MNPTQVVYEGITHAGDLAIVHPLKQPFRVQGMQLAVKLTLTDEIILSFKAFVKGHTQQINNLMW